MASALRHLLLLLLLPAFAVMANMQPGTDPEEVRPPLVPFSVCSSLSPQRSARVSRVLSQTSPCLPRPSLPSSCPQVMKLLALRDELTRRGLGYLLHTWLCPTEGADDGSCNPCGKNSGVFLRQLLPSNCDNFHAL